MKKLLILAIFCSTFYLNLSYAKQEDDSDLVKPIQELAISETDPDQLPKESQIGNLAPIVKEKEEDKNVLLHQIGGSASLKLFPYPESIAFINGYLIHTGYYPQSFITTHIDRNDPNFGLQLVYSSFDGHLIMINRDYDIKYVPEGLILYHYYPDSKVITGSTQVIRFY